jgi:hypothetical protein
VQAARLLCERDEDSAFTDSRLEPDSRIADLWCADQLVQRDLMGLGDRQEQFEAGLALAGLEPREGALRDSGRCGELGQRDAATRPDPLEARTDLRQNSRDRCSVLHRSRKSVIPENSNKRC